MKISSRHWRALALLCSSVPLPAQYTISTIAGGGPVNLPATGANVSSPFAVARDAAGRLYYSADSQVFRVNGAGVIDLVAGAGPRGFSGDGGPAELAQLNAPQGIAVDGSGNLYICDYGNHRVRKVDPATRVITTVAGNGTATFSGDGGSARIAGISAPWGIAADSNGNLYIADSGNRRVRKVAAGTGIITTYAGNGATNASGDNGPAASAGIGAVSGLAIDSGGNLYLATPAGIRKVAAGSATITTVLGGSFSAVAVDAGGNLYFNDTNVVRKLPSGSGAPVTIAGQSNVSGFSGDGGPATSATLSRVFGIAADATTVTFTDFDNNRVRAVNIGTGIVNTVAGNGTTGFAGENVPATNAAFSGPRGIAVDSARNVYVVDTGNHRVRKIAAATGIVTTYAGNGSVTHSGDGGQAASAGLANPLAVAFDPTGNLYIGEPGRIRRVDASTGVITTAAGTGVAGCSGDGGAATAATISLSDLAFDPSGNLFLASPGCGTVRRIAAGGGTISTIAGGGNATLADGIAATSGLLPTCSNLAADRAGEVWVSCISQIFKIRHDTGTISIVLPAGANYSAGPVSIDPDGNALVALYSPQFNAGSPFYYQVYRIPAGTATLIVAAGTGNPGITGDGGPGASALLGPVGGVATDSAGSVYITDGAYNRIRKLTQTIFAPSAPTLLSPADMAAGVSLTPALSWSTASGADSYDVSFGTTNPPPFVFNTTGTSSPAGNLTGATTYYWRVTSKNAAGPAASAVRSFTTGSLPGVPGSPSPVDTAAAVPMPVTLAWTGSGATSYDVYFGTAANNLVKVATVTTPSYQPSATVQNGIYYWSITARNGTGATSSPVWRFTTQGPAPPAGYLFVPVTPCRVADTRAGQGTTGNFGPPSMAAGTTRDLPIPTGRCSIPLDAKAYSLNVTVVPQEPLAYVSLWPTGQAQPLVSTLNAFHGGVVANAAIVPGGTNGSISVFATNKTDVIIDINGYFTYVQGYAFYTVPPCRLADTRAGSGFNATFGAPSLAAGAARSFPAYQGSCLLPADAAAYSLNATVIPKTTLSYLTLWPTGQQQPYVSTLNSFDGAIVANAAIVSGGTTSVISAYATDATELILDTNGYFRPTGSAGSLLFNPVTPCRVADTRQAGNGAPVMAANETRAFAVAGKCGIPSSAKAYSMNVTVVPSSALAYLTLWPAGQTKPLVSTLNSFLGRIVANAAIVPAGSGGAVSVFVTNQTDVILDINGYFQ